jgi:hypothetical protein
MAASRNTLVLVGAILAVVGVIALVVPALTTQDTKEVAKVGDLRVTATQEETHVIPPYVGPAALLIGVVLLGAGLFARR